MTEVAGLVLPVGVHDGRGLGEGFAAEVMVEDHHVCPFGRRDGVVGKSATIDADDQVVGVGQLAHGGRIGAVAFVDPVGDIERSALILLAKPVDQKGRGSAAVDVVIGEDRDLFPVFDGGDEAGGGGFHIEKAARIGQEVAEFRVEEGGCLFGGNVAGGKDAADGLGKAGLLDQGLGLAEVPGVGTGPELPGQRVFDVEKGGDWHVFGHVANTRC